MNEIRIFNIKVHPIYRSEFLEIIQTSIKRGKKIVQNGVNASSINETINNIELSHTYNNSDLVNIDGMSVVWALRFLGFHVPERVACPDLANDILKMAEINNFSVFLLGAKEEILTMSINKITESYPKLIMAGSRNGYFDKDDEHFVVEMINTANPDILFLGMPSPKKEFFVENYKDQLNVRYILGVGGYFDILSGIIKRAPNWMQGIGLEWFYRFIQEPRRMWYRYLVGNLKFVWLVIREKIKYTKKNKISKK